MNLYSKTLTSIMNFWYIFKGFLFSCICKKINKTHWVEISNHLSTLIWERSSTQHLRWIHYFLLLQLSNWKGSLLSSSVSSSIIILKTFISDQNLNEILIRKKYKFYVLNPMFLTKLSWCLKLLNKLFKN